MAKQLPAQSVVCTECGMPVEASPTLDFLGLHKFSCPHCSKSFTYPMSDGRRRGYLIATVVFAVFSVAYFVVTHSPPLPGLLPLLIALGLYRDQKVRAKVAGGHDVQDEVADHEDHDDEVADDEVAEPAVGYEVEPATGHADDEYEPFVGPAHQSVEPSMEPAYAGVASTHADAYTLPVPPPPASAETSVPPSPSFVTETEPPAAPAHGHSEYTPPASSRVSFDDLQNVDEDVDEEPRPEREPVSMKNGAQVKYTGDGSWTLVTKSGRRRSFSFRR